MNSGASVGWRSGDGMSIGNCGVQMDSVAGRRFQEPLFAFYQTFQSSEHE